MTARRAILLAIAVVLPVTGCAGASICAAAGGTYADGTCTRWSAGQEAAEQWCQRHGGVYLRGQDDCQFGAGGA